LARFALHQTADEPVFVVKRDFETAGESDFPLLLHKHTAGYGIGEFAE